jgi:hypothetical protein
MNLDKEMDVSARACWVGKFGNWRDPKNVEGKLVMVDGNL